MKKIISLFQRNYDTDRLVRDEVVPGAEWVPAGEGIATRKWDGTSCMVRKGKLFKRHELKSGRVPPHGFEAAQRTDPVTGNKPGWLPVGDGPEDRWHREAFAKGEGWADGTYELVGPKINGNPERFKEHALILHGRAWLPDCPNTFDALRDYLSRGTIEGIVWHHPDGRMVKIKGKDFGFKRIFPRED